MTELGLLVALILRSHQLAGLILLSLSLSESEELLLMLVDLMLAGHLKLLLVGLSDLLLAGRIVRLLLAGRRLLVGLSELLRVGLSEVLLVELLLQVLLVLLERLLVSQRVDHALHLHHGLEHLVHLSLVHDLLLWVLGRCERIGLALEKGDRRLTGRRMDRHRG